MPTRPDGPVGGTMSKDGQGGVVDEAGRHRYVLDRDGEVAELVYRLEDDRLVLVHTGVPHALQGRGIAGRLVAAAVERAAAEGLTVVPLCPYARRWLHDHPEAAGTVAIDWGR